MKDDDIGSQLRRFEGRADLDPGLTALELAAIEKRRGPLPAQLRSLLMLTGGFAARSTRVRFDGRDQWFEFGSAFANALPIANDGDGRFWFIDHTPNGDCGPVLFASHDVFVVERRCLYEFIADTLRGDELLSGAHPLVTRISRDNPYAMTRAAARRPIGDRALNVFAENVPPGFLVADLRCADRGVGFRWKTAGHRTRVIRDPVGVLLFATEVRVRRGVP